MTRLALVVSDLTHGGSLDLAEWVFLFLCAALAVMVAALLVRP